MDHTVIKPTLSEMIIISSLIGLRQLDWKVRQSDESFKC